MSKFIQNKLFKKLVPERTQKIASISKNNSIASSNISKINIICHEYYLTKNNKYWENRDFQGFTKYDRIKKRAFPADIQNPILNLYINNGLSSAEAYIDIKKFHKNLLDFKDHK